MPQYRSGSCDAVEKAVDREMALRERVEQLETDRENLLQLLESASEVIGRFVSDEGWARSDTRRIDKETEMHLSNLERYEIQAEAFRRMTGHLAPGKDAAAGSYDEAANRTEIYARWAEIHGECVYAVLDAVDCVLRAAEDDEK